MTKPNESLILQEQAEIADAPFFPDFELPEIDKTKPKFHCSGGRLFRDRPDVYKVVVRLLAEPGVSIRTICRECYVSDHTVRSVADREQIPIAAVKKTVLSNITHGLRLASERVIELMPEASTRDALIGCGILTEKMALLSGDATMRIDIGPQVDMGAQISALLSEAREKLNSMKQAQVIEMGVSGENPEQKALTVGDAPENALSGAEAAAVLVGEGLQTAASEGQL